MSGRGRAPRSIAFDPFGLGLVDVSELEAAAAMACPTRCLRCRRVHDAGPVTVVARYADCTMWRCPNCNALIDDRAGGWGGSEPVTIPEWLR